MGQFNPHPVEFFISQIYTLNLGITNYCIPNDILFMPIVGWDYSNASKMS